MKEDNDPESTSSEEEQKSEKSWVRILKLVLEFALAALTALGVTSCISFLNK